MVVSQPRDEAACDTPPRSRRSGNVDGLLRWLRWGELECVTYVLRVACMTMSCSTDGRLRYISDVEIWMDHASLAYGRVDQR
jgi:hypothetical protein